MGSVGCAGEVSGKALEWQGGRGQPGLWDGDGFSCGGRRVARGTLTPARAGGVLGDPTACLGVGSGWPASAGRSPPRATCRATSGPPARGGLPPSRAAAVPPTPARARGGGGAAGAGAGVIVCPVKHEQLPGSACHRESQQSSNLSLEHSALIAGKMPRAYFLILTKHLCMKDLMPGIKHIIVNLPLIKPN